MGAIDQEMTEPLLARYLAEVEGLRYRRENPHL